jgi:VWFA-related protein
MARTRFARTFAVGYAVALLRVPRGLPVLRILLVLTLGLLDASGAGPSLSALRVLGVLEAQTPPAQRSKDGDATDVRAIVVDVVVRDHSGNPVTDLTAQDFEIYEDGVRQDVGSFTPILGGPRAVPAAEPATATTPATTPAAAAAAAPQVIALVFDRLTPEGRAFAHKAALGYVGDEAIANNTIAIFGIDLSLIPYQSFTRDAALLRKAIEGLGGRSTSQFGSTRTAQAAAQEAAQRAEQQVTAATSGGAGAGGGAGASAVGATAAEAQFASMQNRMLQQFESLERDQQGYATSNALMAIVSAMKSLPGRKSVIFFSEGLSIPANVQRQFISVIDAANRANVSIYPMDAAGLRTESTLTETREGIATGTRNFVLNGGASTSGVADGPLTQTLERNEDLLRADPHSGLGTLADQTGGFLIANSNDLRNGFARIDTDMHNYYVLTYVPTNARFDGKFRDIDVKVRRPGLQVRSRKGYYAVRPSSSDAPILSYEAPALAILEQTPLPNAFPVRAMALRFPEQTRTDLVPVIVSVPTSGVTFQPSPDKKTYASDFIVLVRFRDVGGQVIGKMSQRYQINGAIDQMDRAKLGDVLFYREPVLFPGVFTMETVVYDALTSKATVRVQTVDIPAVNATALRLSSIIAIRRSEKVPEADRIAGSPLYVGDRLLYPNMGDPLSKATSKELPFYFVAYPAQGAGETKATLEVLNNGERLAQAPLELAAPDDKGRIAEVSRIPLTALQPGTYQLRVTLRQGPHIASRDLFFRVTP